MSELALYSSIDRTVTVQVIVNKRLLLNVHISKKFKKKKGEKTMGNSRSRRPHFLIDRVIIFIP